MKILRIALLLLLSSRATFAQTEVLPDVLKPDPTDEATAAAMGAEVFKVVPRSMFKDKENSYTDAENPIGIRGGGAYYSFTTRSHSYNRIPQIQASPGLTSGFFSGATLLTDVGEIEISTFDSYSPEVQFFLSYKPPKLIRELDAERKRLWGLKVGNTTLRESLPALRLHTYLLRSITEKADLVVLMKVLRIDPDGSTTIAWKQLAEFPPRVFLDIPDEELQKIVDDIIAEKKYLGTRIVVKDGHLYSMGRSYDHDLDVENILRLRKIHYRGSGGTMPNP